MWTVTDANKGSNEISTCLLKFIKIMKESGIEEFSFFLTTVQGKIETNIFTLCGNKQLLHLNSILNIHF